MAAQPVLASTMTSTHFDVRRTVIPRGTDKLRLRVPKHADGTVNLRPQVAEWADDERVSQLSRISMPFRKHQGRRLAVLAVRSQFPRHRGCAGSAGSHGHPRDDSAARATDAALQVGRSRAAVRVRARRGAESLPSGSTFATIRPPPVVEKAGVSGLECGDFRLLNERRRTVSRQRTAPTPSS